MWLKSNIGLRDSSFFRCFDCKYIYKIRYNKTFLSIIFTIILVLFFILNFVNAQAGSFGGINEIQDAKRKIDTYSEKKYWEEKWDYLGKEWRLIILKNPAVSSIDNFLKRISPIFVIVLGEPYDLSLIFFGIVFLWIFFLNFFYNIFKNSFLSDILPGRSILVIPFLLVVGIAQTGLFRELIIFLGRFAFSPESKLARIIFFIGLILIFYLIHSFSIILSRYMKAKKEENEKEIEKINRTLLGKIVKNIFDFSK
ncbi:MAG: hypothetical protein QXD05_01740 [Candidatus Pacearchaeota archaeon]